jgi:hypothetical protein
MSHILNGHVSGQIQGAPFKLSDVAPVFFCEPDLYLTDHVADMALDPLNRQSYDDPLECETRGQESPPAGAPLGDLPGPATGTSQSAGVLFNRENDLLSNVLRAPIPVAHDVEHVVQ